MSSNYQNNNTGSNNEVFTPTTRSSYKFYNSNSAVQNTVMSISYWNSLLKITMNEITVMEGSANKVDNDNHIDIYLSPSKAKLMLSAHMDEVGFIVTFITEDGFIKFDEVGGIDRRVVLGKSVKIRNNVRGVITARPMHLLSGEQRDSIPKLDE